jgi:hypothetical protein
MEYKKELYKLGTTTDFIDVTMDEIEKFMKEKGQ